MEAKYTTYAFPIQKFVQEIDNKKHRILQMKDYATKKMAPHELIYWSEKDDDERSEVRGLLIHKIREEITEEQLDRQIKETIYVFEKNSTNLIDVMSEMNSIEKNSNTDQQKNI